MVSSGGAVGRIDVHSHLIPGVDDGCRTVQESIACAARMVEAGYTHSFATPHIWPNLVENTRSNIPRWTSWLQSQLDAHGVPLTLIPGGEISLRPGLAKTLPDDAVVSYAMGGKHCLIDFWADEWPSFFEPEVRRLQGLGLTVILAHPERMTAVQRRPAIADRLAEMGVLMQGNLQCLSDPPGSGTRSVIERYLNERRYFLLGSDLHRIDTLHLRLNGLRQAIALVGEAEVDRLTRQNPLTLLPEHYRLTAPPLEPPDAVL